LTASKITVIDRGGVSVILYPKNVSKWIVLLLMASLVACGGGGGGASLPAGRSWGTEQLIETNDLGNAFDPQIAVHANGNALAVWYQSSSSGRSDIWANRYTPASGWGTAELIETNDSGSASDVRIAMDVAGNAIAVWRLHDGTRTNIWANRYDATNSWGTAQLIETNDAGNASSPRVALDPAGNAIVVWHQFDGARNNIWANRYAATAGWGTAELIETGDGDGIQPDVGLDASGDALVLWSQFDGTEHSVFSNRYDYDASTGSGTWGAAALIESGTGDVGYIRIAVQASGAALAVWGQDNGSRYQLWANRYDPGTGWSSAEPIENGTDFIDAPQIELDANGNGIAIWTQYGSTQDEIWVNRYSAGAWGTAMIVSGAGGNAGGPQIAFDPLGNAIAVWHQNDGTRDNIKARHFSVTSSTWGSIQALESDSGQADSAQIGVDADGNAVAVWSQSDGSRYNILANTYR